jgi:hypothetical protein
LYYKVVSADEIAISGARRRFQVGSLVSTLAFVF